MLKKLAKRGVSIEEQHEEWLEDHPLEERRPDIAGQAEAGCPQALIELAASCWADEPSARPMFRACAAALRDVRPARSFATSHFRRCYAAAESLPITTCAEVFAKVSEFIKAYCRAHGLCTTPAELACQATFIRELQRETGTHDGVDADGDAGHAAELLWTSALKFRGMPDPHIKELCGEPRPTVAPPAPSATRVLAR